jgi:hypothetical protein
VGKTWFKTSPFSGELLAGRAEFEEFEAEEVLGGALAGEGVAVDAEGRAALFVSGAGRAVETGGFSERTTGAGFFAA